MPFDPAAAILANSANVKDLVAQILAVATSFQKENWNGPEVSTGNATTPANIHTPFSTTVEADDLLVAFSIYNFRQDTAGAKIEHRLLIGTSASRWITDHVATALTTGYNKTLMTLHTYTGASGTINLQPQFRKGSNTSGTVTATEGSVYILKTKCK